MYGEDLDLSLRLRLAGWGVGVAGGAVVEHDYEFAKGEQKWFLLERNRWLTVLGAYPRPLLAALLPALLAAELALLRSSRHGADGWARRCARTVSSCAGCPLRCAGARAVQAAATVGASEFAAALTAGLDSPFLGPAAQIRPLASAQAAYWRL